MNEGRRALLLGIGAMAGLAACGRLPQLVEEDPTQPKSVELSALIQNLGQFEDQLVVTSGYYQQTDPYTITPFWNNRGLMRQYYYISQLHTIPDPGSPTLDIRTRQFLSESAPTPTAVSATEPFKHVRVRGVLVNSTKRIDVTGRNVEEPYYRLEVTQEEEIK